MKIKAAFIKWMLRSTVGDDSIQLIINEFTANNSKSRADLVAVFDKKIVALEFKSHNDKLIRLEKQITHLKKIYNRVEVVVSSNHAPQSHKIAKQLGAGLLVETGDGFKRLLKGRHRHLDEMQLKHRLFPNSIRSRSNFSPTEEFYRAYLIEKYSESKFIFDEIKKDLNNMSPEKIKKLNPNHIRRIENNINKELYFEELRKSIKTLQSSQSSSKSSPESSWP
jgi:hypothetical protein